MVEPRMARSSPIVKANKEVVGRKAITRRARVLGGWKRSVIDPASGRVAYAALSFGGFLGVGDKPSPYRGTLGITTRNRKRL